MGQFDAPNGDPPRVADIPTHQLLSFVTHDIYGPASMLRTFLQAVADSTEDGELRGMIVDAERLSAQVEGMVRMLRTILSMGARMFEVSSLPLRLGAFLEQWMAANPGVTRDDRAPLDGDVRIVADDQLLAMALDGAAWQMQRMGGRQGTVAMGVVASSDDAQIGLWRPDGELSAPLLERAVACRDEDWSNFLRRLPACGFPLRLAARLATLMGGDVRVRGEGNMLVLAFPFARRSVP